MDDSTGIVRFDDTRPHLCEVGFGDELSADDLTRLFERTRAVFRRRKRFVLFVDASNTKLSAQQRKQMVTLMKESEAEFQRWVACAAIVVRSALARGTLTALSWMMRPPFEQKVFSNPDDAMTWSLERAAGLEQHDRALGFGGH
jgi:hypothetical protein